MQEKKFLIRKKNTLWKIAVPGPTYAGCSFDIVLLNKDESGSYRPAICMWYIWEVWTTQS